MTAERTVLLVVHTGRDDALDVARRVAKVFSDNDIALRVLSAEAVDRGSPQRRTSAMAALGVDVDVVDADQRAAEGCELVLVLGGDGTPVRVAPSLATPAWTYTAAQQVADFGAPQATYTIRVAQRSALFGPGQTAERTVSP